MKARTLVLLGAVAALAVYVVRRQRPSSTYRPAGTNATMEDDDER